MACPTRARAHIVDRLKSERGSALLVSLLIFGALAILAGSIAVVAMSDRNLSKYDRHALTALATAESGVSYAKRVLADETAPMEDYDHDGRPDFEITGTLGTGGTYRAIAEASDILDPGVAAYYSNGFTIISEGRYQGAIRRVKVQIVHDSFFKFARFCAQQGLQFECGDVMAGEVYSGGSINLSCGCPAGQEPHFLEKVYAVNSVPQPQCGNFERGYEERIDDINLLGSLEWDEIRNKARGLGSDNSCGGWGVVGIYINLPLVDPLLLGAQVGVENQNAVVLDRFDFANMTLAPPDTVITYGGIPVLNTLTGQPMRRGDFNGIVFFEGDARVRGTLDGPSGYGVSVFGTDHVLITGDIVAGHTNVVPIRPVTCAVIGENYVAMDVNTHRILQVDAAIFSRTSNWRCLGGIAQHLWDSLLPHPLDLDLDGISGETPFNNDPTAGEGWDELNITDKHWVLNLTGPIITYSVGDAYPWSAEPVLNEAAGPTRRYNYDLDYMEFPPPCFPVPINLWRDVSWTEIFDSQSELASHFPH